MEMKKLIEWLRLKGMNNKSVTLHTAKVGDVIFFADFMIYSLIPTLYWIIALTYNFPLWLNITYFIVYALFILCGIMSGVFIFAFDLEE